MPVPFAQLAPKWLPALTWKLVKDALVPGLALLIIVAIFSDLKKPLVSLTQDNGKAAFGAGQPAGGEAGETVGDFVERVALSHIGAKKAPGAQSPAGEGILAAAANETEMDLGTPLPPKPAAARHEQPAAGKAHGSLTLAKVLPPVKPPLAPVVTAAVSEPAPVSAPVKPVKDEPLPPVQFGMRLVSHLGTMISQSQTRVVESVASVSDTLAALVKKL